MLLYPHISFHNDMKYNSQVKMRSVSAEDLQNIVKKLIGRSHEDSNFFDEWNSKKENESEDVKKSLRNVNEDLQTEKSASLIDCTKNVEPNDETNQSEIQNNSNEFDKTALSSENVKNVFQKDIVIENTEIKTNVISEPGEIIRRIKVRKKIRKTEDQKPHIAQPKCVEKRANSELAFETWKRRKNIVYKQFIKRERIKKRVQLEAKQQEIERKRIAHETYMRERKQEKNNKRSLIKKKQEFNKQAYNEACIMQAEAKRIINEQAFKTWKKKKDMEMRQRKLMSMAYANNCYKQLPKSGSKKREGFIVGMDSQFDCWLNQLDWVLHHKYLRERRHLVHSFYCQPAYYGAAAMYGR